MRWSLLAALTLTSCASDPTNTLPAMPSDSAGREAALKQIQGELGPGFAARCVLDIYFVASDAGDWTLDSSEAVIRRMHAFLTTACFTAAPDRPIRVYLFATRESYERCVRDATGRAPVTPFGTYHGNARLMTMNISTGTGTLAHLLVYPLLEADAPDAPSWFRTGFASLFEQSETKRDGTIVGKPNWRLPGLQRALKKDELMPLKDVLKTTSTEFYSDSTGLHYAVARYLCYWLQEKGLLLKFYKAWKDAKKDDANGIATLEKVTGLKLAELEKTWREFVREIEYER